MAVVTRVGDRAHGVLARSRFASDLKICQSSSSVSRGLAHRVQRVLLKILDDCFLVWEVLVSINLGRQEVDDSGIGGVVDSVRNGLYGGVGELAVCDTDTDAGVVSRGSMGRNAYTYSTLSVSFSVVCKVQNCPPGTAA